jgi:glycosyltransferase involved in cell wall biosynthesis
MTVGYVHIEGRMGDRIRVEAVRRFLRESGVALRDLRFELRRPAVDMRRELASARGLRQLLRKLADPAHPLLSELGYEIDTRQLEASIDAAFHALLPEARGVDWLHAETLPSGVLALRLARELGKPLVFDMHGAAAEEAALTGSPHWTDWCRRREAEVVRAARHVLVVSPAMRDHVRDSYGKTEAALWLAPNGSELTSRQARFASPLTVVFAGNFAVYENVIEYARTAELASARGDRFWLLGDGALRNELFDHINSRGIDVTYFGKRPREVALDYCAQAQVGFVGQSEGPILERPGKRFLGCPIKLFDYASCGLPVVVAPGNWASLVEEADFGVVAADGEAPALAAALETLRDPELWERKSRNAKRVLAERFQWSQVLAPLRSIYA